MQGCGPWGHRRHLADFQLLRWNSGERLRGFAAGTFDTRRENRPKASALGWALYLGLSLESALSIQHSALSQSWFAMLWAGIRKEATRRMCLGVRGRTLFVRSAAAGTGGEGLGYSLVWIRENPVWDMDIRRPTMEGAPASRRFCASRRLHQGAVRADHCFDQR
jgi:hypothetical protein